MEEKIKEICYDLETGCIDWVEASKQLLALCNDKQQRELLKKWWKYFDEESVAINCNDEEREEVITNFFNRA